MDYAWIHVYQCHSKSYTLICRMSAGVMARFGGATLWAVADTFGIITQMTHSSYVMRTHDFQMYKPSVMYSDDDTWRSNPCCALCVVYIENTTKHARYFWHISCKHAFPNMQSLQVIVSSWEVMKKLNVYNHSFWSPLSCLIWIII